MNQMQICHDRGDVTGFVFNFSQLGRHIQASPELANFVLGMVKYISNGLSQDHLTQWIQALAKVGFAGRDHRQREVVQAAMEQVIASKTLPKEDLFECIVGIAACQNKFYFLPQELQERFMARVIAVAQDITPKDLGPLLNALGRFHVPWSALSADAQQQILQAMEMNAFKTFAPFDPYIVVLSMGHMGANASAMTDDQQKAMMAHMGHVVKERDNAPRILCQCFAAFGQMGFQSQQLPADLTQSMLTGLEQTVSAVDASVLAAVVGALGAMGFRWDSLSATLQQSILKVAPSRTQYMLPKELAMLLIGFSAMDMKWSDFSSDLAERLQAALVKVFSADRLHLTKSITQFLSEVILMLGRLDVPWETLSGDVRDTIAKAFHVLQAALPPKELADLMEG